MSASNFYKNTQRAGDRREHHRLLHDKAMPVMLLTADDVKRWLYCTAADALELQKPAPDAAIVVLPSDKKAA